MSMTGARDMSLLQTPPHERRAIETIIAKSSDDVIRRAVLRELNREGQIFFLHNRVMTIAHVCRRIQDVVPEARVEFAHGQMPTGELADTMQRFSNGDFDVLVCTTIIESGTDIPRANTILIDRADRFGMADLYQLRGRVGRSRHKAYAYLLIPSHGHIDSDARKRIQAIRKYSTLSVGFSLALRDLEIRGAGNLLGSQQSGHITAVGFGLYCQLLRRTVETLKGEATRPVIDVDCRLDFIHLAPDTAHETNGAFLPYDYVEDEPIRIALYRRLAEAATTGDVDDLYAELRDRFGPLPPQVARLLELARLRIVSAGKHVQSVETREGKLMLRKANTYVMERQRFPRLRGHTPDACLAEIIDYVQALACDPS
jgi:transcription-repair coupling factor (superfamily II helicase)